MSGEILVRAENLRYTYPFQKEPALRGVSFTLRRGEALLVTGQSGCGKSTLLRILNGLVPGHFKGTLDGTLEIAGRVGTVMQNPEEQILATTVEEEVALELEWRQTPQQEMRRRVDDALARLGISNLAGRSVFSLSSGERQKCVIAATVAAGAEIVVMDEPTANLSPEATEELAKLVSRLKAEGVGVVIVDHRLYWLKGVADRTLVLEDGRETANRAGLRAEDVERTVLPAAADVAAQPGARAAVVIENLSFRYSRRTPWIYDGFSATLPQGKVIATVGANGAGKTTLARLLCGLLKPRTGRIHPCRREHTAFVMQQMDIQLYMRTVMEELLTSAPRSVPKRERLADAEKWLARFGLSRLAERHPHSLSGGEKQRLVIACAMMKRPSLMILDEPTSGLDGGNMRIIAETLREYAAGGGTALLVTHDLELLSLAADCSLEIAR